MSDFPNPAGEEWTDDRLLHEGVWLVEQQLELDPTEVKAWAEFVRKVWAAREHIDKPSGSWPSIIGEIDAP